MSFEVVVAFERFDEVEFTFVVLDESGIETDKFVVIVPLIVGDVVVSDEGYVVLLNGGRVVLERGYVVEVGGLVEFGYAKLAVALTVLLVRIGNGVLVEASAVTGTEVVEVVGGLLVVMELVEVSAVTGTEVVGGLVVVEVKVEVEGLMVEVEQPQEVEVDETPAIRSSWKLIFVASKIVKCAAI